MTRKQVLYTGFFLVFLLWGLHFIALNFYLYWTLVWYDFIMHFLGGLVLGVLAVWFWNVGKRSPSSFLLVFATVMILGGVWEVFEYVNDIAASTETYSVDTINDFVMDALGAVAAYFLTTSRPKLPS